MAHPDPQSSTRPERLTSIDRMRGVAVLAVMVNHLPFSSRSLTTRQAGETYPSSESLLDVAELGRHGVLLFLVISGFAISLRWARHGQLDARIPFVPFWKRRLIRLYPPYLVALLVSLVALFVVHRILGPSDISGIAASFGYESGQQLAIDLLLLLLLSQNLNGASARVGNGPFWSLALEEQLYLLYFPLIAMRRRWGWPITLTVVAASTLAWRAVGQLAFAEPPGFWFYVAPAYWFAWALGSMSAEAFAGRLRLPALAYSRPLALVCVVLGVVLDYPASPVSSHWVAYVLREPIYALGFWAFINAAWRDELLKGSRNDFFGRTLLLVGEGSYSIYLIHTIAFIASKQVFVMLGLPDPLILIGRFGAGLIASFFFFLVFEKPFISRSRRVKIRLGVPK